jgi:hypothetical protein
MDQEFDPLTLNTDVRDFLGSNVSHFKYGDKEEFYKFSSARVSARTLTFATVFSIMIIVYYFTMAFIHASPEHALSFIPSVFTVLLRLPNVLIMLYIRKKSERKEIISPTLQRIGRFCESAHIMGSSFTSIFFLFGRLYNGECSSLDQVYSWSCNSGLASRTLPIESVVILLIQPLSYSIAFKSLRFEYVMATWVIIICALFGAIGMVEAYQTLPALIIYIPLSGIVLLENHRQDLILYLVVQSQRKLLAENKQMSEERTTEMRHMIANVAHDLKTVCFCLVSFLFLFPSYLSSLSRCPPS